MSHLTQGATSLRKDFAFLPSIALEPLSCLIWQHLRLGPANNANILDINILTAYTASPIPCLWFTFFFFRSSVGAVVIQLLIIHPHLHGQLSSHLSSLSIWQDTHIIPHVGHIKHQLMHILHPRLPNLPLPMDPHVHWQHLVKAGVNGCTGWSSKPLIQWSHRT